VSGLAAGVPGAVPGGHGAGSRRSSRFGLRAGARGCMLQHECPLARQTRCRGGWARDRDDREDLPAVLLCLDAGAVAADLAAGTLACPSCEAGQLAPWGYGRERPVRLRSGRTTRLRPRRARCRSCHRTRIILPSWCAPRRADGIEVIGAAAGLAMAGAGHRPIAAALGVPADTVRGWLRRLRGRAEPLRQHAIGELNWLGFYPPGPPSEPAGSPLGDALNALAAAVDCARRNFGHGPEMTWPLAGRLGLARFLMPAPAS
jgi:transposase-like protein